MDKLSTLQRLILVALLCPEHLAKTQRERNAELYKLFFDCDTGSDYLATAQALKREDLLNKYGTVERFEHNGLPVTAKKFGDQTRSAHHGLTWAFEASGSGRGCIALANDASFQMVRMWCGAVGKSSGPGLAAGHDPAQRGKAQAAPRPGPGLGRFNRPTQAAPIARTPQTDSKSSSRQDPFQATLEFAPFHAVAERCEALLQGSVILHQP